MKKIISVIILLVSINCFAEYIFLNDGKIIEGNIVSETAHAVRVKTKDGKYSVYKRKNIIRIQYADIDLSQKYIQLKNGDGFLAYKVAEDRDTYTFRVKLNSPEEKVIPRKQVLFISENNPSGLFGKAGTTTIELKWHPPYTQPKYFNVYFKKSGEDKYKIAVKTKDNMITIENLKSNTEYRIYVTAVFLDGSESLPSNNLTIKTENIHPEKPSNVKLSYRESNGKYNLKISWNAASDSDGKVVSYNIYRKENGKYVKVKNVAGTETTLNSLESKGSYVIKSVDDRGDESDPAYGNPLYPLNIRVSTGVFIPLGFYRDISTFGISTYAEIAPSSFFIQGLQPGIKAGAIYQIIKADKTDSNYIIPAFFTLGYNFSLSSDFSLMPKISAGGSHNSLAYETSEGEDKNVSAFLPHFEAGLETEYKINESFNVYGAVFYNLIYEKKSVISAISVTVGMNFRMD